MRIIFIRHGERRKGETDPALTSAGRRMARETALWMEQHLLHPSHIIATPTKRCSETADEIALVFEDAVCAERPESPEVPLDWERLVDDLALSYGSSTTIALVGHHPTVHLLTSTYGPSPLPVPPHHFASAIVIDQTKDSFSISNAWPGRAA